MAEVPYYGNTENLGFRDLTLAHVCNRCGGALIVTESYVHEQWHLDVEFELDTKLHTSIRDGLRAATDMVKAVLAHRPAKSSELCLECCQPWPCPAVVDARDWANA